jgi:hypothetical protein
MAEEDREKFRRVLDLVQRRFDDRAEPAAALRWAGSIALMQECAEMRTALERALPSREGPKASVVKKCEREPLSVRQADITKTDLTRSRLLIAAAQAKGFTEEKKNGAVRFFKNALDLTGIKMDEQTIRDALVNAENHAATNMPYAEFLAKKPSALPGDLDRGPATEVA